MKNDGNGKPKKRRERKSQMPACRTQPAGPANLAGRPVCAPRGEALERMRPEVRHAVEAKLAPLYDQLVNRAGSGIEGWIGETMVHMAWLETLVQLDQADEYANIGSVLPTPAGVEEELDRCMRLGMTKVRIAGWLMRMRQMAALAAAPPPEPRGVVLEEMKVKDETPQPAIPPGKNEIC